MQNNEKELIRREIQRISERQDAPGDDENLFDSGFLDSLDFMRVIEFIEKEFSIELQRTDLRLKNFSSISTILNLLDSRKKNEANPGT